MCNRLNADIHRIKLQKVALQKTMEGSAKQFAQWRAEREKVRGAHRPLGCLCAVGKLTQQGACCGFTASVRACVSASCQDRFQEQK